MEVNTVTKRNTTAQAADLKIMDRTIQEMQMTSDVFAPYRKERKVTAFGSARTRPGAAGYELAREFGRQIADAGFMVITGGGPGIMEAANQGAGRERSFGATIELPFESANTAVAGPRQLTYKYFFTRKVAMVKESSAIVAFPGGFGTMDEISEVITLIQCGKCDVLPIILVDSPGGTYWKNFIQFVESELLAGGYISPSDLSLFTRVESAEAAVAEIQRFYGRYHSMRYVDGQLVLRLNKDMSLALVKQLRNDFADILIAGGDMKTSNALYGELDEFEVLYLPRLVIDFNRKDFGRLRQLIDLLNE